MKIVVGLGNPGQKYEKTRHNIGFVALEKFVEAEQLGSFSYDSKLSAEILETNFVGDKVLFVKPMSFMNKSGEPLQKIANFYKVPVEDILVVHDEIDLPVGVVKSKVGGGHAGHNGLRSIISNIGKEFHRIRIGVDRPALKEEVVDYVLSKFRKEEIEEIENLWPELFEKIVEFLK